MTLRPEPAASGLLEVGKAVGSRYRLERIIGHGRMGTVWLANDEVLQRPVAIKLTGDIHLRRFTEEARSAARLGHPNLVQVYDFGVLDGRAFLVMEYLPGGSLRDRFRHGSVSSEELRRLACDLLSALAYLHSRDLVHGGVDAARVHLHGDGRAHLSGFGTAPAGSAGSPHDDLRALGQLLAAAPCPGGAEPALEALVGELLGSGTGARPGTAADALERLRACAESAGQATQEFDVLSLLDEELTPAVEPIAARRRASGGARARWAPQRVLTAIGLGVVERQPAS